MTTKIDISSLDAATKKKIKALGKRSKQIQNGVSKTVFITPKTIKFKVEAEWQRSFQAEMTAYHWGSCHLVDFDYDKGYCLKADKAMNHIAKTIKDAHENFKRDIDAEIKSIIAFSDKIADKLGVDRKEFFDQYFLG